jgi:hypothetical protein
MTDPSAMNVNFGDGDQINNFIEDVDRIINQIHYSASIYSASGPACPVKDGGCGGPAVRFATVWLENSDNGTPLNNLGRVVAPPRRPRFNQSPPTKPSQVELTAKPRPTKSSQEHIHAEYAKEIRQLRRNTIVYSWYWSVIPLILIGIGSCSAAVSPESWDGESGSMTLSATLLIVIILAIAIALYVASARDLGKKRDQKVRRQDQVYRQQLSKLDQDHKKALRQNQAETREKFKAYERSLELFEQNKLRHEAIERKYHGLKSQWGKLWYCSRCGERWSESKLDRTTIAGFEEV